MSEFGADHDQICVEFLRRSREYLTNGRLLQASEKGWGAAAHAAKIYADARRLVYHDHSGFNDIATELRLETHNYEIRDWAESANFLHRNFYRDEFDAPQIAAHLDDVANFINLIRKLTGLPPVEN